MTINWRVYKERFKILKLITTNHFIRRSKRRKKKKKNFKVKTIFSFIAVLCFFVIQTKAGYDKPVNFACPRSKYLFVKLAAVSSLIMPFARIYSTTTLWVNQHALSSLLHIFELLFSLIIKFTCFSIHQSGVCLPSLK